MTDEIERLRADYDLLKDDYNAQRAEIERLKAELDLWRIEDMEAEIERLRAELKFAINMQGVNRRR